MVGKGETTMRRLVGIPIKNGLALGLWVAAALSVAAEVRPPGFWSNKVDSLARSGDLTAKLRGNPAETVARKSEVFKNSSQPAYRNDEVAAKGQSSQNGGVKPSEVTKSTHMRLIVISIPDRQLALIEDGELVKVYAIAVGAKGSPSPEGEYTIINHAVNPTYRHQDTEIGPGKDNPLGTRWMGLSLKGYGIHGTNVERSVGTAVSHGCFRMKRKDVEELYARVRVGDVVSIRGQRDEVTTQLFAPPASAGDTGSDALARAATTNTVTELSSASANSTTADEQ
jgi:lipoprotein-anchoring transpeptidase ErfK/SrfK